VAIFQRSPRSVGSIPKAPSTLTTVVRSGSFLADSQLSGKMGGEQAEVPYGGRLIERAGSIAEPGSPASANRQRTAELGAELGRAVAEVIEPILDYVRARSP
jgi:hypothetical protein